jgi:hypothetical protein
MPRFDIVLESGTPKVAVTCPDCGYTAIHSFAMVEVGADVSCGRCGRGILVTPENEVWIRRRTHIALRASRSLRTILPKRAP